MRRAALAVVTASGSFVMALMACGGTTGREGLQTADTADAATIDGSFDVTIQYIDRVLPDLYVAPQPEAGGGTLVDADITALNVHCAQNNEGGACTATELLLIEHDTNPDGTPKADAGMTAFGCYDCMVSNGCLDDTLFASDVDHECGDTDAGGISNPTLSADDPTVSCLSVISCILANQCAGSLGSQSCYCGTAMGSACTMAGSPNGPCLVQEQDGTNSTTPNLVNTRFTDISYAAGMANTLFSCAGSNTCACQ